MIQRIRSCSRSDKQSLVEIARCVIIYITYNRWCFALDVTALKRMCDLFVQFRDCILVSQAAFLADEY